MATFLRPSKKSLKNAQHFEFIDAFITVLTEADFTAAKIVALQSQLKTAFSEEDRWYMIARASEIIALREAADKRRDNYYGRLHAIIKAWAGSGMESLDPAAAKLLKVFRLYSVKTGDQIDTESGQLDNLVTDLSATDMQQAITTLNLTWLYQQMLTAHRETKSYRLEQGTEQSEKVTGALANARKACDALYDELTYLIEAFSLAAEDTAPYEAFIKKWNGTLKIYQDMIDRKSANSNTASNTDNTDNTGSSDNSDNSDNSGSSDNSDNSGNSENSENSGNSGSSENSDNSGSSGSSDNSDNSGYGE